MILCTPPACANDEEYHCPGDCPGGCGTVCATRTPGPVLNPSPTPTIPKVESTCTLPTAAPGVAVEVVLCGPENAYIDSSILVPVQIRGLGDDKFTVQIQGKNDDGEGSFEARLEIDNREVQQEKTGSHDAHIRLDLIQIKDETIYLYLQAASPGPFKIDISVTHLSGAEMQVSHAMTVLP